MSYASSQGAPVRVPGAVGHRRRRAARYDYQVRVNAKCASWPGFLDLYTRDLSAGGMFVPTTQTTGVGERIQITIQLPDRVHIELTGTVVNVLDGVRAERLGRRPGVGVQLDPIEGPARTRFEGLLQTARAALPDPRRRASSSLEWLRLDSDEPASPGSDGDGAQARAGTPDETAGGTPRRVAAPRRGPVIGIDFGTTRTSIAVAQGPHVAVLRRVDGSRSSPSVVAVDVSGQVVVGRDALALISTYPERVVPSPKRLVGQRYGDPGLRAYLNALPQLTRGGADDDIIIDIGGTPYEVAELCAHVLEDARRVASAHLGCAVTEAVIAVPIGFDDRRVAAVERAAFLAGLHVAAVIDEPSAAALANWSDPNFGGVIGVYDFGGGAFDFSVIDVSAGDFRVLASASDTALGGDDFDIALAAMAAEVFERHYRVDLRSQPAEWQRLVFACEHAKQQLSRADSVDVLVPEVVRGAEGMIPLRARLSRDMLDAASAHLVERSLEVTAEALRLADVAPAALNAVYLSGGATYAPAVRDALARSFDASLRTVIPPEYAVCLGAAVHAAQRGADRAPSVIERSLRRRTPTHAPDLAAV